MTALFRPPSAVRVCFAGQSLLNDLPALDSTRTVPYFTASGSGWGWSSIARSGHGYTTLLGVYGDELASAARADGNTDVLVMAISGQGDFADNYGLTPTVDDCYDAFTAYADAGRAAGFDLVLATTIPPSSELFYGIWGVDDDRRQEINALLVADADEAFDVVLDVEDVASQPPVLGDEVFPDGVHLSILGRQAYSAVIRAGIEALLA